MNLIKIKRLRAWTKFLLICTLCLLFFGFYQVDARLSIERAASVNQIELAQLGNTIRQASDFLTWAIREYAITTDPQYLQTYWQEVDVSQQREHAIKRLHSMNASEQELALLKQAKYYSDQLIEVEVRAMKLILNVFEVPEEAMHPAIRAYKLSAKDLILTDAEKISKAREILFDKHYNQYKGNITQFIEKFQQTSRQRVAKEAVITKRATNHALFFSAFNFTLLVVLIFALFKLQSLLLQQTKPQSQFKPLPL